MNWLLVRWVVFSMSMVLVGSSSFCDQGAATVSPVRANSASGYPYPAYLFVLHEGRMIRTNRHARDGLPEHLSLQGDLPPRNVHAIEDALRQWLFFPGLLKGQPVDTPVVFKYSVAGW